MRLKKPKTSKYKGICWDTRMKKWRAQFSVAGQIRFLEFFDTEEEAYQAYKLKRHKLFGEPL